MLAQQGQLTHPWGPDTPHSFSAKAYANKLWMHMWPSSPGKQTLLANVLFPEASLGEVLQSTSDLSSAPHHPGLHSQLSFPQAKSPIPEVSTPPLTVLAKQTRAESWQQCQPRLTV